MAKSFKCGTRVEGLQLSIRIWTRVALENMNKSQAIISMGFNPDSIHFKCGCCEYTVRQTENRVLGDTSCIEHCPISEGQAFGCEQGNHPYARYALHGEKQSDAKKFLSYLNTKLDIELEMEVINEKADEKIG